MSFICEMHILQELHGDDSDKRIEFCEIISHRVSDIPSNIHIWYTNPTKSYSVWAGIPGKAINGPLFIKENLIGNLYLLIRLNWLIHLIAY